MRKKSYTKFTKKNMPIRPFSTDTYTDLAKKFYRNTSCTEQLYSDKKEIKCVNDLDITKCCENKIKELYNESYSIDTCYNKNNTNFQFSCNEEHLKMLLLSILISFIILLVILVVIVIVKNLDCCCEYNETKNKKRNRFKERLLINNTSNPLYGT